MERTRLIGFLALGVVVALTVACGGQAAEPPTNNAAAPAAQAPANEQAPAAAVEPEPMPAETQPDQPALEGNILTSGEDFQWISVTTRRAPATYYWTMTVTNDTTQTLDITVRFDFLDENDGIVKTHTKTVRISPAGETTIREEDSMPYTEAVKVVGFQAAWATWKIVETG